MGSDIKYKVRNSARADCKFVFTDEISCGKACYTTDKGQTVVKLGKFKWSDLASDQEAVIAGVFANSLKYCLDHGAASAVVDMKTQGEDVSYLTYVLSEKAEDFFAANGDPDFRLVFLTPCAANAPSFDISERPRDIRLINVTGDFRFLSESSHAIVINRSFEEKDDYLRKKFESFSAGLDNVLPFAEYLKKLIVDKGVPKKPSGEPAYHIVYKASGISSHAFSKIINGVVKHPQKGTVAALSIGLKLNIEEAEKLYFAAGHILGRSEFLDKVIRFFISERIYSIDTVNECLVAYKMPTIGEQMRESDDYSDGAKKKKPAKKAKTKTKITKKYL